MCPCVSAFSRTSSALNLWQRRRPSRLLWVKALDQNVVEACRSPFGILPHLKLRIHRLLSCCYLSTCQHHKEQRSCLLFLTKQLRQTRVPIWADLNQSSRVFRSRPFNTSSLNSIPSDYSSVSHIIVRSNSNQQNENESTIVSFQLSFQFIELFSIELVSPCVSPSSSHLSIPSLEVSAHPRPSANLRYVCSSSVVTTSLTGKTCRPRKFSDAFPG